MQSKQYFTKIKNYPHEKSTEPKFPLSPNLRGVADKKFFLFRIAKLYAYPH